MKEIAGNKAISESNLFVFLAIIEHKAIQIVSTFKQLSNPGIFSSPSKPLPVQGGMLTFDDFEDNEEYNKILTAEELRQKAKDFLEREQSQKQRRKELRSKKKWMINILYFYSTFSYHLQKWFLQKQLDSCKSGKRPR